MRFEGARGDLLCAVMRGASYSARTFFAAEVRGDTLRKLAMRSLASTTSGWFIPMRPRPEPASCAK